MFKPLSKKNPITLAVSQVLSSYRPVATVLLLPLLGYAGSSVAATTDTKQSDIVDLGTTVVTARGFVEDSLETPFVVDTIRPATMNQQHMVTIDDAVRSQPSVDEHNGGNTAYSSLWMRGTGSLSITSLDDNSVDLRIDGVSNGKTGLARNLIDIESVQIAKGPQGTLLGSKAEAGSIIIKTNDPDDEFTGHVSLGMGNKHLKEATAVINVPLSKSVALRIAGMSSEEDNYLLKRENNAPLNTKKKQGVQAKLRWHNDTNDVVLGVYQDTQKNDVPMIQTQFDNYKIATFDLPHSSENSATGVTLATKHDVGFASFESNTGYHKYDSDIARPTLPPEYLPIQYAALGIPAQFQPSLNAVFAMPKNNRTLLEESYKQISQEIRLASKSDSKTKWVTGIYIDKKDRDWHNDGKLALDELPDGPIKAYLTTTSSNGDSNKTFDSRTTAIFGEVTLPVTDALDVVAGARYTHEKLTHTTNWVGNSNNALAAAGQKSDSKVLDDKALTGRLGLSYALQPNWRVYALQSRGNKFGGFADYESNVVYGNAISSFKPTTIDASEIGTKYHSADKRLNMGLALYQNTMKDDHITVLGAPPTYDSKTANVDSRSRGAELSLDWRATDHISIKTDLAYTDTEVTDASNVPEPNNPTLPFKLTKEGNQMPQVPKYSGSLAVSYRDTAPMFNNAQWYVGADYRYVGKRFAQSYNVFELDSYGLLGLNMGIAGENHELNFWAKNLTNEKYLYIGIQPGNVGTLGADKSFGMKYSYYF